MRTVVGIIIADHLPGVKIHRLNAHVLALSRIAKPADLIIVTRVIRPVFKSISSRYKPARRWFRASLAGSLDNAREGYRGGTRPSYVTRTQCVRLAFAMSVYGVAVVDRHGNVGHWFTGSGRESDQYDRNHSCQYFHLVFLLIGN